MLFTSFLFVRLKKRRETRERKRARRDMMLLWKAPCKIKLKIVKMSNQVVHMLIVLTASRSVFLSTRIKILIQPAATCCVCVCVRVVLCHVLLCGFWLIHSSSDFSLDFFFDSHFSSTFLDLQIDRRENAVASASIEKELRRTFTKMIMRETFRK